jgi:hypothetical protein
MKSTQYFDEERAGGQQQNCREHYYCFHLIYLLASGVGDSLAHRAGHTENGLI